MTRYATAICWQDAPHTQDPELIREIEAMTPGDIEARLLAHGIAWGAGMRHYEAAKRAIFRGAWIDGATYDRLVREIVNFLEGGDDED